jgi:tRNA(Ile)-lysidine synthase TilS/MesJ
MTWKTELRLDDLDPHSRLEAFCTACSAARYYTVQELLARRALAHAHLDEVETALKCVQPGCGAPVALYEVSAGETEAFQGGMP